MNGPSYLSFAGEQRSYVEEVAKGLKARGVSVFYDRFETTQLWGKHGAEEFHDVFARRAAYVVMFISRAYAAKVWPTHERKSALSRMVHEDDVYVLPVRFDDTPVQGLLDDLIYLQAADYRPVELAKLIAEKVGQFNSSDDLDGRDGRRRGASGTPATGDDGGAAEGRRVSPSLADRERGDSAGGVGAALALEDFVARAKASMPLGYRFDNPGGGTSRIVKNDGQKVCYMRGNSRIYARWRDLHAAYKHFAGRRVSSSDLKKFMPRVFDSSARPAGHSCNCTFLFHLLERMSLTEGGLQGRGVAGDPFAVRLRPTQGV